MLIGERHGPAIPAQLTTLQDKRDLFATDSYFWEGWEDLVAIAGEQAASLAKDHTLILLKPDAVAARRLHPVIDWLLEKGFSIVSAHVVHIERHVIRLLWQYQWNIARRERKDACDLLLPSSGSLLLVARSPRGSELAATVLFSNLKGPADPSLREPGQLRHRLGPRCTLLNFVHSADEPADLVRESAICLEPEARRRVFADMLARNAAQADARALAAQLESTVAEHSLLLEDVLERLRDAAKRKDSECPGAARAVLDELSAISEKRSRGWQLLLRSVDAAGIECSQWDRITLAAHLIVMDFEGWDVLIPGLRALVPRHAAGADPRS